MTNIKEGMDAREIKLPDGFDVEQMDKAVKALLKFAAKSKEDTLFLDAPTRILMDIRAFKTPSGIDHMFNIRLPHAPYTELKELDVLLVVPDVVDRDPDHVVGDVRDALLESSRSETIKVREVMTFKQFRDDYSTYEAKRALAKSVDVVIAERKVWKMIPGILGRDFLAKKKFPLCIPGRQFKKVDIGEQIWFALHKTVLNLSLKGLNSTLVVGHDNLTSEELGNNVKYIIAWLNKSFPGGWCNLQKISLHIGQPNMPPLPIYFSEGSRNDVPSQPSTRRKIKSDPIEDEISTQLGKRMKVFPTGHIKVVKSDDRDELDDIL